jgi:hypothetical protein
VYSIRRLNSADFDRMLEIFKTNNKFQHSIKDNNISHRWELAHRQRIANHSFAYFGYFVEEHLIAFIQGEVWKKNDILVATIGWTVKDKSQKLTKSHGQLYWSDEIIRLENALIDFFLENGVMNIYCTVAADSKSSRDVSIARLSLFNRYVLERVPANSRCLDEDLFNHVYGRIFLPIDQDLVEYRHEIP